MPPLLLGLVSLLNCNGVYLLGPCELNAERHAETRAFFLPSLLFQLGVATMLGKIPLLVSTAHPLCFSVLKFFVHVFVLEVALCCYWYPLETFLHNLPTAWDDKIGDALCSDMFDFCSFAECFICPLKEPFFTNLASTVLSALFLLFVVHATQYVKFHNPFRCPESIHRTKLSTSRLRKDEKIISDIKHYHLN